MPEIAIYLAILAAVVLLHIAAGPPDDWNAP